MGFVCIFYSFGLLHQPSCILVSTTQTLLTLSSYRHEKLSDKKREQNPNLSETPSEVPILPVLCFMSFARTQVAVTWPVMQLLVQREQRVSISFLHHVVPHCGFTDAVFQRTKAIHHRWVRLFFFPLLEIEAMTQANCPCPLSTLFKAPQLQAPTCSWNNQSSPDW